jgi:glycosyltransferase involved in cell wall biosynthesis
VAARVARAVPEAHFLLAGDGELRDAVLARAAALGLAGRLHLLGWRRDIPRVMAALDVFVLTSLWEGLPRVVPEAIACGVPVVATLVDGTAEVLRDGDNALACAAGDLDGLASRVARLLADPALARALAGRARLLLPEFDIDAMVRAQEALYAGLNGGGPGR